jgi:hypothetical protein
MKVQITNTGKEHAFSDVLSFSDDFQTWLIKPVTVEGEQQKWSRLGSCPRHRAPFQITPPYQAMDRRSGRGRNGNPIFKYSKQVIVSGRFC